MTAEDPIQAADVSADLQVTDLVARARRGDKRAWDALVDRYAPLIWFICRGYRLSREDAEDVAQNVWMYLVENLDKVRTPAAIPGWLTTATRWECARVQRRAAHQPCAAGHVDASALPDEQAVSAEQELVAAERHDALHEALGRMAPGCRRLLELLIADPPVPYAEISTRLGISVGSIGPTRARCLDKLRRDPAIAALIDAGPEVGQASGASYRDK
jgi:RNA polymerase sigma factor (sigma-70 family)